MDPDTPELVVYASHIMLMYVVGIVYSIGRGFDHADLAETAMKFGLVGIPMAWWKLNHKSYDGGI